MPWPIRSPVAGPLTVRPGDSPAVPRPGPGPRAGSSLRLRGSPGTVPHRSARPPPAGRRRRWPRPRRRGRPAGRRPRRPGASGRPPGPSRSTVATTCPGHPLQGVGHREHRDGPVDVPGRTASTTAANRDGAGQRAGGVVDHDDVGVVGHGGQAGPDRVGPGGATGDHHGRAPAGSPVAPGRRSRRRPASAGTTSTTPSATERAARHRPGDHRPPGQREELLAAAEPATRSAGHHDGPDGPRSAQGSASLRRTSAVSSSTPRAKVSSDTRIWRARLSMRFSPADRPLSLSRMERFRTTSATW